MLAKGGFLVKWWQLSGKLKSHVYAELSKSEAPYNVTGHSKQRLVMLKGTDQNLRVFVLGWNPEDDSIIYEVTLNFY